MTEPRRLTKAGAREGLLTAACPCCVLVLALFCTGWVLLQGSARFHAHRDCKLPPFFAEESLVGSRRQSKVKYIYRLLRHGDIGESLTSKTVRPSAVLPPAISTPGAARRGCLPCTVTHNAHQRLMGSSATRCRFRHWARQTR